MKGRSPTEGIVQVFHNETKWGDICVDKWTINEAKIVCKSLGLELPAFAIKRQMFASNYGRVKLLRGVKCMGNESFIGDCQHPGWGTARWCYNNVAAVVCGVPKRKSLQPFIYDKYFTDVKLHSIDSIGSFINRFFYD